MSSLLNQVYSMTGQAENKSVILSYNQSAGDIVASLLKAVRVSLPTAQTLAKKLKGSSPEQTALNVYDFMRQNYIYRKESSANQTSKTLPRIILDSKNGSTGDCKHYSTTAATIFKALGMPVYFRVIDQVGRWNHIYVVLKYANRTIIVDGTYPYFNREKSYIKNAYIKV